MVVQGASDFLDNGPVRDMVKSIARAKKKWGNGGEKEQGEEISYVLAVASEQPYRSFWIS